ncbi:MAG: hypothetical protein RMJ87_14140 [Cytophagales bacterium]|nr:hypothetical protein [Bernardetiaceae bacterium]MDW8206164.1 hypothetical protein [Cytophagales bacterium]
MGLAKIFWILSLAVFLAVLLITYIYMPENVAVLFDELGLPYYFLPRDYYFYAALMACVLLNGAVLLLGSSVSRLPSSLLPVPKRHYWAMRENRSRFSKRFAHWTKGIAFFLNLILCLWLVDILKGNDSQIDFNTQTLLYVVSVLLILWVGFYFMLFGVYVEKLD